MTEEHRIKIAAAEWAYDKVDVSAYQGYIAGATAENEHLRELHKWLNDDILTLKEQLKQERNKAIDDVKNLCNKLGDTVSFTVSPISWDEFILELESLKH